MKTQVITRKIKLFPIGDKEEINRVYKYIRDGQYAENKAYNILISHIYSAIVTRKSIDEIKEIYKLGSRDSKSKLEGGSLYDKDEIIFPIGLGTASSVRQKVQKDLDKAKKDGLYKGRVSLPNKRLSAPLTSLNRMITFYHEYEDDESFKEHLYDSELRLYMKFANGISFKVILGNPHKSAELRSVFENIFSSKYKVCDSSMQIDGKNIMLNLSLQIPIQETELDENIVVGVDLGIAVPAVCGLNTNEYDRLFIGNVKDFLRIRTKIQAQYRQLKSSLKISSGGHGREKKMNPTERFKKYENNFVQTYNHMVSKNIVDFAVKHNAKYINMEDLSGYNASDFILRNWSYYQLQQYVEYKANMKNIIVRYINPYHTSQNCSKCGHWEQGQRDRQDHFKCKSCEYEANADFNASRNIALNTDFRK